TAAGRSGHSPGLRPREGDPLRRTRGRLRPSRRGRAPARPGVPTGNRRAPGQEARGGGQPLSGTAQTAPRPAGPRGPRPHAPPEQETRIESQLFSGTAQTAPEPMGPVVAGLTAALQAIGDPDAEVELLIRSAIPHSRGLGSSAAVATSVARAVASLNATVFDEETLHEIVQQAETVAHGRPSGIDAWAVAKPAPIRF